MQKLGGGEGWMAGVSDRSPSAQISVRARIVCFSLFHSFRFCLLLLLKSVTEGLSEAAVFRRSDLGVVNYSSFG